MHKQSYYVINGITLYRVFAAPVLFWLIFTNQFEVYKWLLPISFFTDLIDGFLARKYKVTSIFGSRLDSVADDLTVISAIVGLVMFNSEFIKTEIEIVIVMLTLYLIQNFLAWLRYHKMTSFHTYSAKVAAVFQGVFLFCFSFYQNHYTHCFMRQLFLQLSIW